MSASSRGEGKEEASIVKLRAAGKLSPQTRENYILRVKAYLKRVDRSPDEFVREVRRHPKKFEEEFVKFIGEVSKSSAPSTTAFWRDSLRRFLEINRVKGVDWDYVNQFLPRVRKSGQDRAPTVEEIRKLVSVADIRTKCLVLFLCSSGARIGSVEYLRWGDVQEVESEGSKLAKVTVYRGEPEEYTAFVTPECYEYLIRYREVREGVGENVGPASPVFIQEVNKRDFDPKKIKPVGVRTLKNQLGELLNQLGMRSKITDKENYRSYEFKQAHGFRKFFKTRMEMSGVKPIITEILMGHEIGVAGSYMKPTADEMMGEYAKAIPNLTILGAQQAMSKEEMQAEFKKTVLAAVGFKPEEIEDMKAGSLGDADFQAKVKEKLLGGLANNGAKQKVVPVGEVEKHIAEGWEFVDSIGDKVILKLPT